VINRAFERHALQTLRLLKTAGLPHTPSAEVATTVLSSLQTLRDVRSLTSFAPEESRLACFREFVRGQKTAGRTDVPNDYQLISLALDFNLEAYHSGGDGTERQLSKVWQEEASLILAFPPRPNTVTSNQMSGVRKDLWGSQEINIEQWRADGRLERIRQELVSGSASGSALAQAIRKIGIDELRLDSHETKAIAARLALECKRPAFEENTLPTLKTLLAQTDKPVVFPAETSAAIAKVYLSLYSGPDPIKRIPEIEALGNLPAGWGENSIRLAALLSKLFPLDKSGNAERLEELLRAKTHMPNLLNKEMADFVANILPYDSLETLYLAPNNLKMIGEVCDAQITLSRETLRTIVASAEALTVSRSDDEKRQRIFSILAYAKCALGADIPAADVDVLFKATQDLNPGFLQDPTSVDFYLYEPLAQLLPRTNYRHCWEALIELGMTPSSHFPMTQIRDSLDDSNTTSNCAWEVARRINLISQAGLSVPPAEAIAAGIGVEREQLNQRILSIDNLIQLARNPLGVAAVETLESWLAHRSQIPEALGHAFMGIALYAIRDGNSLRKTLEFITQRSNSSPPEALFIKAAEGDVHHNTTDSARLEVLRSYCPSLPGLAELRHHEDQRWLLQHAEELTSIDESHIDFMRAAIESKSLVFCPAVRQDVTDAWGIWGFTEGFFHIIARNHNGPARTLNEDAWLNARGAVAQVTINGHNLLVLEHEDFFPHEPGFRQPGSSQPGDLFHFERYTFDSYQSDSRKNFMAIVRALDISLPRLMWEVKEQVKKKGFICDDRSLNPEPDPILSAFRGRTDS
jgi:hypothetical protein